VRNHVEHPEAGAHGRFDVCGFAKDSADVRATGPEAIVGEHDAEIVRPEGNEGRCSQCRLPAFYGNEYSQSLPDTHVSGVAARSPEAPCVFGMDGVTEEFHDGPVVDQNASQTPGGSVGDHCEVKARADVEQRVSLDEIPGASEEEVKYAPESPFEARDSHDALVCPF